MTLDILPPSLPANSTLGVLSGQQLEALLGQVRDQWPVDAAPETVDGLKDTLGSRAEPMAQGVVSALGLASIALLSEARADQALGHFSPLRTALDALDATFLSTEPALMGLIGPNANLTLGALRGDVAQMEWSELVRVVEDLSSTLSADLSVLSGEASSDAVASLPVLEGLAAILADAALLDPVEQTLPVLETALADAGVVVPNLLASGALGVAAPSVDFDPLAWVSGVNGLTGQVLGTVGTVVGTVVESVTTVAGGLLDAVDTAVGSTLEGVNQATDALLETVGGVTAGLTDAVEGLLGGDEGLLGGLTETTQDLVGGLDTVVDTTVQLLDGTVGSLVDLVDGTVSLLGGALAGLFNSDTLFLGAEASALDEADGELVDLVADLLGESLGATDSGDAWGAWLPTAVEDGVVSPLVDAVEVGTGQLTDVVDTLAGEGGLLGNLVEPLVSTEDAAGLLGSLGGNLLG
ncbi:hypothetical protein [Aquabacterium sp. A08]|uniref:hypothetical protein n=1 Tax=Aquabacterium sp. A08 TaxID=2718532 RepID=UPI00141DC517|nr:hypothetical protein [Aquabacterium sp. A08]NIC40991.1 hypothetical protein [Aquabacterium sp. A08]